MSSDDTIKRLVRHADSRGSLVYAEIDKGLPFVAKRMFTIADVPAGVTRGGHAHRVCHQWLVALEGRILVAIDDGTGRREHLLDAPDKALHLPPGTWGEQTYLDAGSRLLVLASHGYDPDDYIHDHEAFTAFVAGHINKDV